MRTLRITSRHFRDPEVGPCTRAAGVELRLGRGSRGRPPGPPRWQRLGFGPTKVIWSSGRLGEWRNGRRAGFRCQCPSGRGGSSPPSPTAVSGSMNRRHKGHGLERGRDLCGLWGWLRRASVGGDCRRRIRFSAIAGYATCLPERPGWTLLLAAAQLGGACPRKYLHSNRGSERDRGL